MAPSLGQMPWVLLVVPLALLCCLPKVTATNYGYVSVLKGDLDGAAQALECAARGRAVQAANLGRARISVIEKDSTSARAAGRESDARNEALLTDWLLERASMVLQASQVEAS